MKSATRAQACSVCFSCAVTFRVNDLTTVKMRSEVGCTYFGKFHHKIWIIVTICQYFSMGSLSTVRSCCALNLFNFLVIRLSETHFPYNVHASYAIHDMLNAAAEKLLPVLPQLIVPMNKALNTRNVGCIGSTLQIIQRMCMCCKY